MYPGNRSNIYFVLLKIGQKLCTPTNSVSPGAKRPAKAKKSPKIVESWVFCLANAPR